MKLAAIVIKEARELLTPATILPAVMMMFIFAGMGSMVGSIEKKAMEKPNADIEVYDNGSYALIYSSYLKENLGGNGNIVARIEIPHNFSLSIEEGKKAEVKITWFLKGTGISSSPYISSVRRIIEEANKKLSMLLAEENKINASLLFSPVRSQERSIIGGNEINAIPEEIISFFSSQSFSVPIVIMIMIITSGGIIISSMGMEKENKTLETLLTLPVKRSYIIAGKIIGASMVGIVIASLYMIGLHYYAASFKIPTKNLHIFSLDGIDYMLIGISFFFSLLAALSLCIVIGSFAKNYKSSQVLSLPVSILAIIPMFILMFQDFFSLSMPLKLLVFLIPFSHPMMAPSLLMLDRTWWVISGIIYSAIFSLACILIAAWIFKTDLLITGRIRK